MRNVQTLIAEAIDLCHGQAGLARRLGMTRQDINHLQTGKRPLSPELVGLLCDVVHADAEEARWLAVECIVTNPKNAKRREVLRRVFLGLGVAGAVVLCGVLLTLQGSNSFAAEGFRAVVASEQFIHCGVLIACAWAALAGLLRFGNHGGAPHTPGLHPRKRPPCCCLQ